MPSPSYTYTLTNGTTADASQVTQNFNDILNGVTDGTKDLSISAITAAGTATFNGNVNLGNSTSDDLSITASLATSIAVKTNASYDFGAATLGLRSVYLGNASSYTVRLLASASQTATYTITLPVDVPAGSDYVARFSTSGVMTFGHPGPSGAAGADADTTLTLSSSRIQIVTPTADRSYTLPTTGVKIGDEFHFVNKAAATTTYKVKVYSSGGNLVATFYPATSNSVVALQDTPTTAAHWIAKSTIVSNWLSFTPTYTNFSGSLNAASIAYWRRIGDSMEIIQTARISSFTSMGALRMTLPDSQTANSSFPSDGTVTTYGQATYFDDTPGSLFHGKVTIYNSDNTQLEFYGVTNAVGTTVSSTFPFTWANSDRWSSTTKIPISGWGMCTG